METRGGEFEPRPKMGLDTAVGRLGESQMLMLTDNGYRLINFVQTSETALRGINAGETKYEFRVPVWEPIMGEEAKSLDELLEVTDHQYPSGVSREIVDDEFDAWLETLPNSDELQNAATKELNRRESEGDHEKLDCVNCKGIGSIESTCSCQMGGIVFVDITEEDSGTDRLREEGEIDPDCGSCQGSGKSASQCMHCEGSKKIAKYPTIILVNNETNQEVALEIDIAKLVENGELENSHWGFEVQYDNGEKRASKSIQFKVGDYLLSQMEGLGIDPENSMRVREDSASMHDAKRMNFTVGEWGWQKDKDGSGKRIKGRGSSGELSPDEVIAEAQDRIARSFSWPYGKIKDDEGVVVADEWRMQPIPVFDMSLDELKAEAREAGYFIGVEHSFIATGETGPSFYLLDENGQAVSQLSVEYDIREALESARLRLKKINKTNS